MAPTIPTVEPGEIVAGDSAFWNITDATYPPSEGWLLSYVFADASVLELGPSEITPDPATGVYQVRVPTAKTADLKPGTYSWSGSFANADTGERHTTRFGACWIKADATGAAAAPRQAEAELAMYLAARDKIVYGGVKAYQVQGRAFTMVDLEWLEKKIGKLRNLVSREHEVARKGYAAFGRSIRTQFRGPY